MSEIDMGEFTSFETALAEIKKNHSNTPNYSEPWWGDKESGSGNLKNRGFVIGFRDTKTNTQWRLDYDKLKRLHINWTKDGKMGQETIKECYRISSTRPQDTLFDHYISWTRSRADDIPEDIKGRLDKVGGVKKWNGRYWGV